MNEWKEAGLRKKNYRRGGLEPDPPKNSKSKHKGIKLFKVEYKYRSPWFTTDEWYGWDSYRTLELAMLRVNKLKREGSRLNLEKNVYSAIRVINKKTKEVIWEDNEVQRSRIKRQK